MAKLIALMQFWDMFMTIVTMIEKAVPDDTPGTAKLDMALKTAIQWNTELSNMRPELEKMFGFAKAVYVGLKAIQKA